MKEGFRYLLDYYYPSISVIPQLGIPSCLIVLFLWNLETLTALRCIHVYLTGMVIEL